MTNVVLASKTSRRDNKLAQAACVLDRSLRGILLEFILGLKSKITGETMNDKTATKKTNNVQNRPEVAV